MTTKTIRIYVEQEPRAKAIPEGVILNRPAPTGGSFLIDARLPREDWNAAKQAGANYLSADDLEDFDMFESTPGWRYSLAALEALVRRGYTLVIEDQNVATVEALRALYTDEAKEARRVARREADAARRAAEEQAAQDAVARRDAKQAEYEAWKAEHLANLVKTYARPPQEWYAREQQVVYFDKEVGWYTTGDRWYRLADDEGNDFWHCSYGNADAFYGTRETVDALILNEWQDRLARNGETAAARWALTYAILYHDCIGGDVAVRLVELQGEARLAELAGREPWVLDANAYGQEAIVAMATRLGIAITVVTQPDRHLPRYTQLANILGRPDAQYIAAADGGRYYVWTGRAYLPLTDEETALVMANAA